jgi:hypothetical protein
MPYPMYSKDGKNVCVIQHGQRYWVVETDTPSKAGELRTQQAVAQLTNTQQNYTAQQLDQHATHRRWFADTLRNDYFRAQQQFTPLKFKDVVYLLEVEALAAVARRDLNQDNNQANALATHANTALSKLVLFAERYGHVYDRFGEQQNPFYRYSLEDSFVGETAHIHAAHAIHSTPNSAKVKYRCITPNPNARFAKFMQHVPTFNNLQADAKTDINEVLIAPRTVGDPAPVHQKVFKSFISDISLPRRRELAAWIGGQFQAHQKGANVRRVGIWIRYLQVQQNDQHTTDQNMSKERFQRILEAVHRSGVDEVILLGDTLPAADWLHYPTQQGAYYSLTPGNNQGRVYERFLHPWTKPRQDNQQNWIEDGLPRLQRHHADYVCGYAEQAILYTTLYRNPDANTHINMECIITNKSGGPDLPSLAGVPQIQIAEMAQAEVFVHHRMGFQSLCSPMWTVVRAVQRNQGDQMTLSNNQITEMAQLVTRASRIRAWHMQKLGGQRHGWQNG